MTTVLAVSSVLLLTAIAVAPWGGSAAGLVPVLLPAAGIHYWALRRPAALPEIAVLLSGMSVDILVGGVFGFWTSVYVAAWGLGTVQSSSVAANWKVGRFFAFAASMGLIAVGVLAAGAVLGDAIGRPGDVGWALIALLAAYPVLAGVLRLCDLRRPVDAVR